MDLWTNLYLQMRVGPGTNFSCLRSPGISQYGSGVVRTRQTPQWIHESAAGAAARVAAGAAAGAATVYTYDVNYY